MNNREDPNGNGLPKRRHLRRLTEVFIEPARFLVTVTPIDRQRVLQDAELATATIKAPREARLSHSWQVGLFVIMPDHVHFFCRAVNEGRTLSTFVGAFKGVSTREAWQLGRSGRLWQRGFHDHLLRSPESYARKCEYVRMNPVRAGLCEGPEDWPYCGRMDEL